MKNFTHQKSGMSLPETLIAVAVFSVISLAVANFGAGIFNFNLAAQTNLGAQSDGRRILKTMTAEMRSASVSSTGAYPLESVATSSITFYSDLNDDGYKEKIRYYLAGVELRKGVISPSGNPLTYNSTNEQIGILVHDVVNGATPIFEYFDQNYNGAGSPLTYPLNVSAIRLIKITLYLDKDQKKAPGPVMVTSQVNLRNLKDNL